MTAVAFALDVDASYVGAHENAAALVKFDGWELITRLMDDRPDKVPARFFFAANLRTIKSLDYPRNDQSWPIMSRRMREALVAAGDFAHRAVPVVMLDHTVANKFDTTGNPRPGVALHGFCAINLLAYSDAFDWERSEYEPHRRIEGRVQLARTIVLKEVALPPLFRLAALPQLLLVSAAGRARLEASGVKGIRFKGLDALG
jgi:hypothetical protein